MVLSLSLLYCDVLDRDKDSPPWMPGASEIALVRDVLLALGSSKKELEQRGKTRRKRNHHNTVSKMLSTADTVLGKKTPPSKLSPPLARVLALLCSSSVI